MTTHLLLPAARVPRWCANFESRHGGAAYDVIGGALRVLGVDGSLAELRLPFDRDYAGIPTPGGFVEAIELPSTWGVLLVRKGGFAVARLAGPDLVEHKVGQRHVQGRTKAGGQSQQRFARRRDNQARAAYEAAADHAARILTGPLETLVTGGDQAAVDAVLADPRLTHPAARRASRWLPVADPKRAVLDQALLDAQAAHVTVTDT